MVRFDFHAVLDVRFEIRDEHYGGSLGPTLTVRPNVELIPTRLSVIFIALCPTWLELVGIGWN